MYCLNTCICETNLYTGIKIIGGRTAHGLNFGVFIRTITEGGAAARDGRYRSNAAV